MFPYIDVIPGKFLRGVTTAEKNERRKQLFKKIKRNVIAVGGNNRRKKLIYKKFTDHKNRTKKKVSLNVNIQEVIYFTVSEDKPFFFSVHMTVYYQVWVLTIRPDYQCT